MACSIFFLLKPIWHRCPSFTQGTPLGNSQRQKGFLIGRGRSAAALIPQSSLSSWPQAPPLLSPELYLWEGGRSKDKQAGGTVFGRGTPKDCPRTLRGFTVWVGFEADFSLALLLLSTEVLFFLSSPKMLGHGPLLENEKASFLTPSASQHSFLKSNTETISQWTKHGLHVSP